MSDDTVALIRLICGIALLGLGAFALIVMRRPIAGPSLLVSGVLVVIA